LTDVSVDLQIIWTKVSEQDSVAAFSWGVEKSNGKVKKRRQPETSQYSLLGCPR